MKKQKTPNLKSKKSEVYFCLYLTQFEHEVVEHELEEFCKANDIKLHYYRQLREGKIPMYREVKMTGEVSKIKNFIKDNFLSPQENPHKTSHSK